jgi:SAM-dependent methyltransferase|tara:strand:- start:381 stop:962 length:582 start_codon:yes stop_codon:yes gene_type:complete
MSLDSNSWNQRYLSKNTGWDIGYVSTPLKEYFDQLKNKDLRILIPGCGNSHEAEYLFSLGFQNVYVLDFSKKAINNFSSRVPGFPKDNLLCEDFFNISGNYDLIIEQTFFCAINKSKRFEYVNKIHSLLNKNGRLVGLLFNGPMNDDHPPFGGSIAEYKKLFSSLFDLKIIQFSKNSISSRNGKELFINFLLK